MSSIVMKEQEQVNRRKSAIETLVKYLEETSRLDLREVISQYTDQTLELLCLGVEKKVEIRKILKLNLSDEQIGFIVKEQLKVITLITPIPDFIVNYIVKITKYPDLSIWEYFECRTRRLEEYIDEIYFVQTHRLLTYSPDEIKMIMYMRRSGFDTEQLMKLNHRMDKINLAKRLLEKGYSTEYIQIINAQDFEVEEVELLIELVEKDVDIIGLCGRGIYEKNIFSKDSTYQQDLNLESNQKDSLPKSSHSKCDQIVKRTNSHFRMKSFQSNGEMIQAFYHFAKRNQLEEEYVRACIQVLIAEPFTKEEEKRIIKWLNADINIFRYITYQYTRDQINAIARYKGICPDLEERIKPAYSCFHIFKIAWYYNQYGVDIRKWIDDSLINGEPKRWSYQRKIQLMTQKEKAESKREFREYF